MEQTIAVVGGTGNLGAALARRWAKAGKKVIIGSRTAEKAQEAAVRLSAGLDTAILSASNLDAARAADLRSRFQRYPHLRASSRSHPLGIQRAETGCGKANKNSAARCEIFNFTPESRRPSLTCHNDEP